MGNQGYVTEVGKAKGDSFLFGNQEGNADARVTFKQQDGRSEILKRPLIFSL